MGMGIAFTFLALAALVAPVVWLAWWAADAAVSPRRTPAPAVARGTRAPRTRTFDYPLPADTRRPGHADAIGVYETGGREVAVCTGPDAAGRCPKMLADGTVPCAGHVLVLPAPVRGSRDWHIPAGYQSCLVGSYGVFRQPPLN